ncbi:MAG: hypothetical protein ABSH22_02645 [Tepidisphaeraceae bacterium]|jgi:hypothetical protein
MSDFLDSSKGKTLTIAVIVAILGAMGWIIWGHLNSNPAAQAVTDPIFMDAETGYVFHAKISAGMSYPVISPDTGKPTGYEPELCYWTKDGHVKSDPTPVLLNIYRGISGPTFCPDCGRLVVAHNPMAIEGQRPPPTEAEYRAMHPQTPTGN